MSVPTTATGSTPEAQGEVFIGRRRERDQLAACAGKAREGQAWLAVVEGEAGIGKSALTRQVTTSLTDFTILWATGDASETDLPGGIISQLIRRVEHDLVAPFPLLTADGAGAASASAIGGQLLLLLGVLQESRGPVAIVVDDVHWADQLSMHVLGFVLRRLSADRVLTVLATRSDAEGTVATLDRLVRSLERAVRVEVGGLGEDEVALVARQLLDLRLAPELVERLHSYTNGHPLYLRTVLAEVPVETLRHATAQRWPAPRTLRVSIKALLDQLPPESVALLEAMAVLAARLPLATVGQVAGVPDPAGALGPALKAGLVQWWPTESQSPVTLVHALQRDAVYDAISPERRRALHLAAAGVVATGAAWAHRVAAAVAADPVLAAELEQSGAAEAAAGRNALAATRLQWAAELSDERADRERRLLTACAQSLLTMQPATAMAMRPQIEDCAPCALRSCVLGLVEMMSGRFPASEARLTEAWREALAEPEPGWVAVLAGTFLATVMIRDGRGAETADVAARTLAIGDLDPATTDLTRTMLATGRMWDQGPGAALPLLEYLPAEATDVPNHQLDSLATRGVCNLFLARIPAARADLAAVALRDRQGAGSKLGHLSLALLAVAEYVAGDWDASESTADRAQTVAAAQDHVFGDAAAGFAAVCVHAGRGRWDAALAQIDTLGRMNEAFGSPAAEKMFWALSGAVLGQAQADPAAMLRSLEPLLERVPDGARQQVRLRYKPLWLWQQSLLVEALTGVGELEAAARALEALIAEHDGEGYAPLAIARLSGYLAEAQDRPGDALAIYEQAVAETSVTESSGTSSSGARDDAPFFRAMLEHRYGKLLVATGSGSRREATRWFRSARDRYGALRAAPFLERCDADLAAVGLTALGRTSSRVLTLTERELSVAHLIVDGRTNQEAAAELYVSQKTVEYHLSNIYGKLGISSRRQLGEALRAEHP